ncbi:regulatory subunit of protein phosphatase 2A [Chloropicon primus]|uniref:Regulatory subunit of protein phosphatase 2A n=1 Tax=Chloropicon primus TaxID=1764295 RepID=A0A5B8MIF3_9CHLO|nr:regulatory subunit of protein phosphatase 2A [Chloropicon primus]UPQ99475.1 regulatory subunit of protein phosphatase 2A [Chloropicon primus]|eukprot:QDZ20266.1 regulatory subunit of protein phosphatase 2A [Chloropicon primus]
MPATEGHGNKGTTMQTLTGLARTMKTKVVKLKPCSKAKIDELFVAWLSFEKTQELISSLVEDAQSGLSLNERSPQAKESGKASPSKQKHFKQALGSPPLSPSKSRTGGQEGRKERRSLSQIPRFYFPNGEKPVSEEVRRETREKISRFFDDHEGRRVGDHANLIALVKDVLGLPSFFTLPLFSKVCASVGGSGDTQEVTEDAFVSYWNDRLACCSGDQQGTAFEILADEQSEGSHGLGGLGRKKVVTQRGLNELVECVVKTHPGLDFLVQTKEFQDRYLETCVHRIFYLVNLADNGMITYKEFRKSELLGTLVYLDAEADINLVRQYFSYEHFYVIYCKFWELDADHDFLIGKDDLLRYGSHALTCKIVDRIFSEAPRKFKCKVPGYMCYEDFVWFILSEEDKTTEASISYWFRCLDLAGNMVLVSHELEHFYQEQAHRIQCLNQEPISFEDILTQLTDMLHPEMPGAFTLKDFKRQPRQASNLFNVLFNLKKFFSFEMKDPRDKRHAGVSDWDKFAMEEYARLAMEEEMEEQYGNADYFIDETELLLEAMDS